MNDKTNDRIITKDDKRLVVLLQTIDQLSDTIGNISRNLKPGIEDEQYLRKNTMKINAQAIYSKVFELLDIL
ncbi:hypothetical protein [Dysgonomonas reticulitermitis]